jgi:hypothetical protein
MSWRSCSSRHCTSAQRALFSALVIIVAAVGCRSGGKCASTVTQQGVAALRVGMTKDHTVAALGAPLSSGPSDDRSGEREVLAYAEPRVWHLGGHQFLASSGVSFVVMLQSGRLTHVYIADTSATDPKYCACTVEQCAAGWARVCLSLFPTGVESLPDQKETK